MATAVTVNTGAAPGATVRCVAKSGEFDPNGPIITTAATDSQGRATFSVAEEGDYWAAWQIGSTWHAVAFTTRTSGAAPGGGVLGPHAETHQAGGSDQIVGDAAPGVVSPRSLGLGANQAMPGNTPTGGVDASTTAKGIAKTSVAPASPTNPIVVGDNDPRVTADQAAGTASTRTLGAGAQQAMPGNAFSLASWQAASADQGVGQATIPTSVSTQVMASNSGRLEMTIVNVSDTVVYLALGAAAQANRGIRLNANGGSYSTGAYTGAVNAFHSGGADKILAYVEI